MTDFSTALAEFSFRQHNISSEGPQESITMAVSGEVTGRDTGSDSVLKEYGLPTDKEIAAKLHKIPPGVSLMGGEGTEAKPAEAAGTLLKLKFRRAAKLRTIPLLDGAVAVELLTNDDQPYAGGYHFVDKKENAFTQRKITLYDKDEKVVATCLQARAVNVVGREDYHIYGQNPMYEGHVAKNVEGLEGPVYPVYQWMELKGIHLSPYYDITSYKDKKQYDPLCLKGAPKKVMSGMNKGVILTPLNDDSKVVARLFHKKFISNDRSEGDTTGWDLTIAPGVDPLPIACITAILDHMEGQNF